jgi:hypothetical protein
MFYSTKDNDIVFLLESKRGYDTYESYVFSIKTHKTYYYYGKEFQFDENGHGLPITNEFCELKEYILNSIELDEFIKHYRGYMGCKGKVVQFNNNGTIKDYTFDILSELTRMQINLGGTFEERSELQLINIVENQNKLLEKQQEMLDTLSASMVYLTQMLNNKL